VGKRERKRPVGIYIGVSGRIILKCIFNNYI
jgi:hypothetical protein